MINISESTPDLILKSALTLKSGNLVAFPTETVYGLGADATNELAVSKIYSVKGRPTNHPVIVHISSADKILNWANKIPDYAHELVSKYWPGPMTLILPRKSIAKDFITGGQESIGLRVPNQSVALNLLSSFESVGGLGIAAPSANRFGAVSPTTAVSVQDELGKYLSELDVILDGGQCLVGIESTIIDCTSKLPSILRPGAITYEMISEITKVNIKSSTSLSSIRTSGSYISHYSPRAKIVLNSLPSEGQGFIALENIPSPKGVIRLIAPKTVEQFAKDLYLAFRFGDQQNLDTIVVLIPDGGGISEAIKDRLFKAAGLNN